MSERIIKETMLNLRELMPIRRTAPARDIHDAVERGLYRVRPGTVVRIMHTPPPHEVWSLLIRGHAYSYTTEAEALAFLKGKYTNAPKGLRHFLFDLQLFCANRDTLPRDEKYYSHPVIQHLSDHSPWCVQYRGNGTYFDTFAELCAYIEGRWGRYIGEESTYA